jgi:hypothetical protein
MGSSAPCALFALGVTVAQRPIRRVPHEIGFMLRRSLLLHPVLIRGAQLIGASTASG